MDTKSALWWFLLNFLSLIVLGFFSMQEMACVSFNRIRLHYYVSKAKQRAIWLYYMLENPIRLFGVTLLGVNIATFVGSECARELFIALGISPNFSALPQVVLVVIFAELAPMFAARHYAEHVAFLGAPILYVCALLLKPVLWSIQFVSWLADLVMGNRGTQETTFLNQEDLQKIMGTQDEGTVGEKTDVDEIASNIFSLRNKEARQIMQPIHTTEALPSNATVSHTYKLLQRVDMDAIPIYHRDINHIVGIVRPRNLLRAPNNRRIGHYASPPWFITQHMKITQILKEFRRNNQSAAIVLNERGQAIGMVTLDLVTEEIFGKIEEKPSPSSSPLLIVDRTFPGEMRVSDFNAQYNASLPFDNDKTLAELIMETLGHHPEDGESVYFSPFELTTKESTLLGVKKVTITTRLR